MENPPFEDVFPIQDGDFPLLCLFTGWYVIYLDAIWWFVSACVWGIQCVFFCQGMCFTFQEFGTVRLWTWKFHHSACRGCPIKINMLDTDHFIGILVSQRKSWIRGSSDSVAAGGSAIDLSAAAGGPYTTVDGGMEMADFSETLKIECLILCFFVAWKTAKKNNLLSY